MPKLVFAEIGELRTCFRVAAKVDTLPGEHTIKVMKEELIVDQIGIGYSYPPILHVLV